eukprot:scaffold23144_cov39-Tisochrysis_lutea.AAC.2
MARAIFISGVSLYFHLQILATRGPCLTVGIQEIKWGVNSTPSRAKCLMKLALDTRSASPPPASASHSNWTSDFAQSHNLSYM